MSMEFNFLTSEFDGDTAELHSPVLPFSLVAVDTISGGIASFGANLPDFAVRIVSGGSTVLRTGVLDTSIGDVDTSGDFSASFLTMRLTDPDDTVLAVSDLEASITLPIIEGDMTITAMNLATVGGDIRATGSGSYAAGFLGDVPFDFTYDFDLDPVGSALSTRVIEVETMSTSVVGTAGGLLGWILNMLVGLIAFVFKGTIEDEIEDAVQERVDAAVDDAFTAAGAPAGAMATLLSVSESSGDVTIDPMVCIPLSQIDCASLISSGSVRVRSRAELRKLRLMRDRVLLDQPQGKAYVILLRRHSREIIRLLVDDPKLLRRVDELVARGLDEFDSKDPAAGVMSARTADAARSIMKRLAAKGSRELRAVIEQTLPEVDGFVGRPVEDAFRQSGDLVRKIAQDRP